MRTCIEGKRNEQPEQRTTTEKNHSAREGLTEAQPTTKPNPTKPNQTTDSTTHTTKYASPPSPVRLEANKSRRVTWSTVLRWKLRRRNFFLRALLESPSFESFDGELPSVSPSFPDERKPSLSNETPPGDGGGVVIGVAFAAVGVTVGGDNVLFCELPSEASRRRVLRKMDRELSVWDKSWTSSLRLWTGGSGWPLTVKTSRCRSRMACLMAFESEHKTSMSCAFIPPTFGGSSIDCSCSWNP